MTKEQLLQEIDQSRRAIRRDTHTLRDELNFGKKLGSVVKRQPLAWLGGAALTGFVLSLFGRRPPKVIIRENGSRKLGKEQPAAQAAKSLGFWGMLFALFKVAFPAMKPFLSAYAARRLAEFVTRSA